MEESNLKIAQNRLNLQANLRILRENLERKTHITKHYPKWVCVSGFIFIIVGELIISWFSISDTNTRSALLSILIAALFLSDLREMLKGHTELETLVKITEILDANLGNISKQENQPNSISE